VYEGALELNTSKPDGTPQKLMDVTKLSNLGWKASIGLEQGITSVYNEIKDTVWS